MFIGQMTKKKEGQTSRGKTTHNRPDKQKNNIKLKRKILYLFSKLYLFLSAKL